MVPSRKTGSAESAARGRLFSKTIEKLDLAAHLARLG